MGDWYFLNFQLKITSLAHLVRSGLKFVFHWNTQVLISAKSLLKSLTELVIFSTTENRDVWS